MELKKCFYFFKKYIFTIYFYKVKSFSEQLELFYHGENFFWKMNICYIFETLINFGILYGVYCTLYSIRFSSSLNSLHMSFEECYEICIDYFIAERMINRKVWRCFHHHWSNSVCKHKTWGGKFLSINDASYNKNQETEHNTTENIFWYHDVKKDNEI